MAKTTLRKADTATATPRKDLANPQHQTRGLEGWNDARTGMPTRILAGSGSGIAKKKATPPRGKKGQANKDDAADDPPAVERYPPCRPCLKSALHGRSDGTCLQKPNKRRYERCSRGGECSVIPPGARDVCLFFWTYHRAHPNVNDEDDEDETNQSDIAKEKRNRRIAAKAVLKGHGAGEFPATWDARGEERQGQDRSPLILSDEKT